MARFIANTFGPNCEVVIHDLSNLEASVVFIENGAMTNRIIGDTITDFGLEIVHNMDKYHDLDYVSAYTARGGTSGKTFKSSTFFIRSTQGKIIGLLCINVDVSDYYVLNTLADRLFSANIPKDDSKVEETGIAPNSESFVINTQELIASISSTVLSRFSAPPERLTLEEKREVIRQLEGRGVFLLKGSVNEIARLLDVSEQTIYRYLKGID